jgi:PilZ domain
MREVRTYPTPLVFAAQRFTIAVVTDNRRTATRHPVDIASSLVIGDGAAQTVRISNLSIGGALVVHPRIPMGQRVRLTFRVPTMAESDIEISATVRWSTDIEVGVQFDGLRPKDVWALSKYFETL